MLTKLSAKGQIVIPQEIRERLNLEIGDNFVVAAKNNIVILKKIKFRNDFENIFHLLKKLTKKIERKL